MASSLSSSESGNKNRTRHNVYYLAFYHFRLSKARNPTLPNKALVVLMTK